MRLRIRSSIIAFLALPAVICFVPFTHTRRGTSDSNGDKGQPCAPLRIPYGPLRSPSEVASTTSGASFSILTWNCLLPNSHDNWWCEKMYQPHVPTEARLWPHRKRLIRERIELAAASVVCIQEAAGGSFDADFDFMEALGYQAVLHKKFRFRCATFYRPEKFALEAVAHRDRTLLTALRCIDAPGCEGGGKSGGGGRVGAGGTRSNRTLYVVNVHLSGGASPDRRLRQMHEATETVRKWAAAATKPPPPAGRPPRRAAARPEPGNEAPLLLVASPAPPVPPPPPPPPCVLIAGDFNSDGNTAVRQLLVDGCVPPEWREPQYPGVVLTSRPRGQRIGRFTDAAEAAYGQNVCDGDWGDWGGRASLAAYRGRRPATYVVPALAAVFLQRAPAGRGRQIEPLQ